MPSCFRVGNDEKPTGLIVSCFSLGGTIKFGFCNLPVKQSMDELQTFQTFPANDGPFDEKGVT